MPSTERDNARRRRERIPGVVLENLEDSLAIYIGPVRTNLRLIQEWINQRQELARRDFDNREVADLLRLSQAVAALQADLIDVERKLRDARSGEHRERGLTE